jgi:rhodanese-related sulfurtransferase
MSQPYRLLPLFGCLLLAALPGIAAAIETATDQSRKIISPESIEGVINVDSEGLIGMIIKHDDLVLVDSRIISDRNDGYIEGSISLPDIDTNCASLAKAAPSLTTPLIFYCNGIRCGRSANAAVIARDCKYRNIYWFRNGMEEWQEKEFPLVQ